MVNASHSVAMRSRQCPGRYLTVQAQTGAVKELCAVGKDCTPALRRLPSGDVLLAKDGISSFLGSPIPLYLYTLYPILHNPLRFATLL